MRSFGGLIGSVMGGAAKGGMEYAKQRLDVDLKKELLDAEAQKLLLIDESKRTRDIRDIPLKGAAETGVQVNRTTAVGAAETGVQVNRTSAVGAADTGVQVNREIALRDPKAATAKATAIATGTAERENLAAFGNDSKALAGLRKKTEATETLSSRLQGKLAELGIAEKEKAKALIDEYDKPNTSPERKAQIKDALIVRGIIKPGEFDTEKVTTETTDGAGNSVKTERTQRRTTPGGAASEPNNGPFKIGATREVQSGPNKGKTVEWDGQGWKLKD